MPIPIYPTNKYTTIDTVVDNMSDYREKRVKPIVDAATGLTTLDHPTRTLYDFGNLSNQDFTDYLWVLGGGFSGGVVGAFVTALMGLSVKDKNYFTKEKQIKLLRLTERARKVSFEMQRLNSEGVVAGTADTSRLPDAPESKYPSSQTIRSFPGR